MPEVFVARHRSSTVVSCSYSFGEGIFIRELAPIRWDTSVARGMISDIERGELANVKYWLCAGAELDNANGASAKELCKTALMAAWAMQRR
jgi:hypothetical protein